MLAFAECILNQKKKKKERKDERHTSQIGGKSGDINQQGEVARRDPQVTQQTIHVFTVNKLKISSCNCTNLLN